MGGQIQLTDDTLSLEVDGGEGRAAAARRAISLSSPHLFIFISALSYGFRAPLGVLHKPFLIVLSVINLFGTDSILPQPARVCFHLPPCLLPSSIALPRRMLRSQ